jgi:hypothetical protein
MESQNFCVKLAKLEVYKQVKSVATIEKSTILKLVPLRPWRLGCSGHSVEHALYSVTTWSALASISLMSGERAGKQWRSLHFGFFDKVSRSRVIHVKITLSVED